MRALLCAAVLLGGCTLPLTRNASLRLGVGGRFAARASAPRPAAYVGLRLSLDRHP